MLAWSFVRDDQPLADTARQVALALRDEVADPESAGTTVIQVDEPACARPCRCAPPTAPDTWPGPPSRSGSRPAVCGRRPGSTPTCATPSSATSSRPSTTSTPTSSASKPPARTCRSPGSPPSRKRSPAPQGPGGDSGRAAVGQPRLRAEDPGPAGDPCLPGAPGGGGPHGALRTAELLSKGGREGLSAPSRPHLNRRRNPTNSGPGSCHFTLTADQAAATAWCSALPEPYRSAAAWRVAVRAPA